jgi:hypothetical protein
MPPFIKALVSACDQTSQNQVAKRLGYSGAVVSQVIRNSYPGDMTRVETQVRMILIGNVVDCPALGEIQELDCHNWQEQAGALTSAVPTKVRMFRACRGCECYKGGEKQ